MQKRFLSAFLAFILLVGLLPAGALADDVPEFSAEADTETVKEFNISSEESLRALAAVVNGGGHNMDGITFYLTEDIELNGEWTPIGFDQYAADVFAGTFNGNGRTVSGLSINASGANQGLFAYCNGAAIEDLIVEGSIDCGTSNYIGGIVGKAQTTTIRNCAFHGSVSGGYTGGIVGGFNSTGSAITGCYNAAAVTGTYAGGILGYGKSSGSIEDCYNTGEITGSNRAGGIAGQLTSGTISRCYNIGGVAGGSNAGGIFGFCNVDAVDCYHLYPETENVTSAGAGGVKIASPDDIKNLGGEFVPDTENINGGYPLLSWQSAPDVTPSISLSGGSVIYADPSDGENGAMLTATLQNMDGLSVESVVWTVEKQGGGNADSIAVLEEVSGSDYVCYVKPASGGTATVTIAVTANGTEYSASRDITVIPHITFAEIKNVNSPGAVAAGQTVEAKVYIAGGGEYDYENFPPLSFQWKYKSSASNISGATERSFVIPEDYAEWDKLFVEVSCAGKVVREAMDTSADIRSADYGILFPIAYDEGFTLPADKKDSEPLALPSSHTVGGVKAGIEWTNSDGEKITALNVTQPESGKVDVTLKAKFTYGTAFANRTFTVTVWSQSAIEEDANKQKNHLEDAAASLGSWYKLNPIYGVDTNVADMVAASLAENGFGDVDVTLADATEVYGSCSVAPSGDITYFYADPNSSRSLWFGRYDVSFTLSKDGASLVISDVPVTIHWDAKRAAETLKSEILDNLNIEDLLVDNTGKDNVISDLNLPRTVDNKLWTQITWTSSDPSVISDDGAVIRGVEDKVVTLGATFSFQLTGAEEPITLHKTYAFTVEALGGAEADALRAGLMGKLSSGFGAVGLRDFVTGQPLQEDGGKYLAMNDIQFPTTRDFGVDGKYYPITISSGDENLIVAPDAANAARATVYRPLPGEAAKDVTVTVTMADKRNGVSVSKDFVISVQPLSQQEIDDARALMDSVAGGYFDGINNGRYANEYSVSGGLSSFQEAVWDGGSNSVKWIYDSRAVTNSGIIADELDNWAEQEAWRAFRSSDPKILDHETLNYVSQPQDDTFVRINSVLTHEVFGKYWEKFGGTAGYEDFEELYKQPVSAYVLVAGRETQVPAYDEETLLSLQAQAVERINAPISVNFTLRGADGELIQTTVDGLASGATVFEAFRLALSENGYSYTSKGSYIRSITDPYGSTLSEKDSGANSGWIYRVNGSIPGVYMNAFSLEAGDEVVVLFTKDYTREEGYDGGAGGGAAAPESKPGDTKTVEVKLPASADADGAVKVSVDSGEVTKALEEAVKAAQSSGSIAEVSLAVDISGSAESLDLALPASALKAIAEAGNSQLTIQSGLGTMTFDGKTISGISQALSGGEVIISLTRARADALDEKIRSVIGGSQVYDLSVTVGANAIHHFAGKATVFLPCLPPEGVDADDLSVFYVDEAGTIEQMEYSKYDKTKEGISFTTDHFSIFAIAEDISALPFNDVRASDWFYSDVRFVYERNLFCGVSADTFEPAAPMTRAMLEAVLNRMGANFSDICGGMSGPEASLTRQDFAVILYRYAGAVGVELPKVRAAVSFADQAEIADYAGEAVTALYEAGVINGRDEQRFDPTGVATRAEAAAMLNRFISASQASVSAVTRRTTNELAAGIICL